MNDVLLVVVVIVALGFDLTNGFHDTANAIATAVGTRAMTPRVAVAISASMNFAGAFLTTAVAKTVAQGLIDTNLATLQTLLAALLGAIAWNLVTWYYGLPSSSSHALFGGLIGAALAQSGSSGVLWHGVAHKVVIPAVLAPAIAFAAAFVFLVALYWLFKWVSPGPGNRGFRLGQIGSSAWVSFNHGANDAQKTMGIIALALALNNGDTSNFNDPDVGEDRGRCPRSRPGRTWAAGGSSARWGSACTAWSRRRASPRRRRRARRSTSPRSSGIRSRRRTSSPAP